MAISTRIQLLFIIIWAMMLVWYVASAEVGLCDTSPEDGPRAAQVCQALITFVEMYAKATHQRVPTNEELVRENPQLLDMGMRRKDLAHWQMFIGRR